MICQVAITTLTCNNCYMKKNKTSLVFSLIFEVILSSCAATNEVILKKDFTDVYFNSQIVNYDGNEHILDEIINAPEDTNITYLGRDYFVDAGVYEAKAILQKDGYNDLTLTANLTIRPIDFNDITFDDLEVIYDGNPHEITCQNIPSFAKVTYTNNKATEIGTYTAKAVISAKNYNDLTLTATLKIIPKTITGISLHDQSFEYDGIAHSLKIEGTLPEGVSVRYSNNSRTDVGSHTVTATLLGKGYETLILTATLTIVGKTITGVKLEDKMFVYDGSSHSLTVEGSVPNGVSITYANNSRIEVGEQIVTATLSGINYATLTLTATLKIISLDDAFCVDESKEPYRLNGELKYDDIFNELLKGNYSLRYYSGSRHSKEESIFLEDLQEKTFNFFATDNINAIRKYHSEYNEPYDEFNVYCAHEKDVVHHTFNFYGTGSNSVDKFPLEALKETEIQYYPACAFTALNKGNNGELLPGHNSDDYYGNDGEFFIKNNHLYIKHEHSRNSSNGVIYFYEIYEFFNIGNTTLNIPNLLFYSQQQIDDLDICRDDFYIDGVGYGYHLVSTYNSPLKFMAHTYLRYWQKLIVAPGSHIVCAGFYNQPVQRVVFNYYGEQKYVTPNMIGYELNFYFDEDGNYLDENEKWGTVIDKSADFELYGGVVHYYGQW